MSYKIELRYAFRWGDAGWTEDDENGEKPWRFQNVEAAQKAIDEFFADVKQALGDGNMDQEENPKDYRIVWAGD